MRFGFLLFLSASWLALPACGGVSLEDVSPPLPSTPSTPADCGSNTCGACEDGYVHHDKCEGGKWTCGECVPRPGTKDAGIGQCTMAPACTPGDTKLARSSDCPTGATCYSKTTCGVTIHCASMPPQCDGIPTCDPGDEVTAPPDCATVSTCYQRSACGSTILCKPAAVWQSDTTELVANDDGGGFAAGGPPGSACKWGEARYKFTAANNMLTWKVCNTAVTPWSYANGSKALSFNDAQSIKFAASAISVSKASTCGFDKSMRKITVTSPSKGAREFLDSFYACMNQGTYVDNIDAVFGVMDAMR